MIFMCYSHYITIVTVTVVLGTLTRVPTWVTNLRVCFLQFSIKAREIDVRNFTKSKLYRSLVHKKNFGLI